MVRYRELQLVLILVLVTVCLLVPTVVSAATPTVVTGDPLRIEPNSATVNFEVTSSGGWLSFEFGIEYGTRSKRYKEKVTVTGSIGTGFATVTIPNLKPRTTYYYRAIARNQDGWGRGEERSFTTTSKGQYSTTWLVSEDVWVGRDTKSNWYIHKSTPVIFAGYSCLVDIACGGGFRFASLGIPGGSRIDEAYLIFVLSSSQIGVAQTRIRAELGSAVPFTTVDDYFSRRRTSTAVEWVPDTWFTKSPDISSVIQEVVAAGMLHDIVIFWDDHDDRSPHGQPHQRVVISGETKLVVTWTEGSGSSGGGGDVGGTEEGLPGTVLVVAGVVAAIAGVVYLVNRRVLV